MFEISDDMIAEFSRAKALAEASIKCFRDGHLLTIIDDRLPSDSQMLWASSSASYDATDEMNAERERLVLKEALGSAFAPKLNQIAGWIDRKLSSQPHLPKPVDQLSPDEYAIFEIASRLNGFLRFLYSHLSTPDGGDLVSALLRADAKDANRMKWS